MLVSINYRLGAQGFRELPDAPANRAVRDWVVALQWVQENIAAFGGEPAKVTIGGQSAGGGACATLLGVPAARPLFRSAICMSGGPALQQTAEGVRSVARKLARHLGIPLSRDALDGLPDTAILAAQEAVSAPAFRVPDRDSVIKALGGMRLQWAPWVDGDVVTQDPWQAASSRRRSAGSRGAAFVYDFQWPSKALSLRGQGIHCLDIPFAFDGLSEPGVTEIAGDSPPVTLADDMHRAWVSFVTDGSPGWEPYEAGRRRVMIFGAASKVLSDPLRVEREAWSGVLASG